MALAFGQKSVSTAVAMMGQGFVPSPLYDRETREYALIQYRGENTHNEPVREFRVDGHDTLEELDLLLSERNRKRVDVLLQILHLAHSDDGENVRRLVQMICDRDYAKHPR